MARIRTVKPELFSHEELYDLELETGLPIRLAFIGLFTVCDRAGRFKWRPRTLKVNVLPYDDCDFSRVLDALATRGFVVEYESQTGEKLGCIPTWDKHQSINNRETHSQLASLEDSKAVAREPRVSHASPTPLCNAQGEGKGREGKGKEGKGTEGKQAQALADVNLVFDFWKKIMGKGQSTKLTTTRKNKIKARLSEGYTIDDIQSAIVGCTKSSHHMGSNPQSNPDNRRYDDIELICRTGDKLEQFIGYNNQITPGDDSEAWITQGEVIEH